jgi:small subunit ribosomal protein S16
MALKIRLRRMGAIRKPFFRLVVADNRASQEGAYIECIGNYHPLRNPCVEKVNVERAVYWLKNGAKPTESALRILKRCGVIEKLKT